MEMRQRVVRFGDHQVTPDRLRLDIFARLLMAQGPFGQRCGRRAQRDMPNTAACGIALARRSMYSFCGKAATRLGLRLGMESAVAAQKYHATMINSLNVLLPAEPGDARP